MATLLYVKSSIFGDHGQSSQLAEKFVAAWKAKNPGGEVVVRDLSADVPPYLDAARVTALFTPADQQTAEQKDVVAYSDALIKEIQQADALVVAAPMYNFALPAQMKSYLDYLARAGVTFKYTETGSVGLLESKPVYVITTRGGMYKGTEADVQTPFIKLFLGFIGLNDVTMIHAEGLNMGDEAKEGALAAAAEEIAGLL